MNKIIWLIVFSFATISATASPSEGVEFYINASDCKKTPEKPKTTKEPLRNYDLKEFNEEEQTIILGTSSGTKVLRINSDILFIGLINDRSVEAVKRILQDSPNITRLVVSSGGGESSAGMNLAQIVIDHQLPLQVVGMCLSACANYLLSAAPEVLINGVVGFHGAISACFDRHSLAQRLIRYGVNGNRFLEKEAAREIIFLSQNPSLKKFIDESAKLRQENSNQKGVDWLFITPKTLSEADPKFIEGKKYRDYEYIAKNSLLFKKIIGRIRWSR